MAHTTVGLILLAGLVAAGGGSPNAENMPTVTYRLIDLAGLPPEILEAGAATAQSTFSRVGLRLEREDVPVRLIREPGGGCAPSLHVFILTERSFRAANPAPDTHAYTAAGTEAPPAAMISFHRVERTAARYGLPPGVLFGHVMAHELGHLLLGRESHGLSMLMKGTWGSSELMQLAQGMLLFSPADERRLRARVDRALSCPPGVRAAGGPSRVK